jgi:hypothetical protein
VCASAEILSHGERGGCTLKRTAPPKGRALEEVAASPSRRAEPGLTAVGSMVLLTNRKTALSGLNGYTISVYIRRME